MIGGEVPGIEPHGIIGEIIKGIIVESEADATSRIVMNRSDCCPRGIGICVIGLRIAIKVANEMRCRCTE